VPSSSSPATWPDRVPSLSRVSRLDCECAKTLESSWDNPANSRSCFLRSRLEDIDFGNSLFNPVLLLLSRVVAMIVGSVAVAVAIAIVLPLGPISASCVKDRIGCERSSCCLGVREALMGSLWRAVLRNVGVDCGTREILVWRYRRGIVLGREMCEHNTWSLVRSIEVENISRELG
jgi:hypothetical protein